MQWPQIQHEEAAEMLSDLTLLTRQVGSSDGLSVLGSLSASFNLKPVTDLAALRVFLSEYQARVLMPLELELIYKAHQHTVQNESRELIALDRRLGVAHPFPENLSKPSRYVGQRQLKRLRPLRDHRVIQRYLHAVETNKAHGWHSLVYGAILAIYGLPLRQGLLHYACQTQIGFLLSAANSLVLSKCELYDLEEELLLGLPASVEGWLKNQASPGLMVL